MGPWAPARLAVEPASGRARPLRRRLRHAGQDLQGAHRRVARIADARTAGARGAARRLDGAGAARAGGGDRVQRRPGEPALSGRAGAALCARQRLPAGQEPWRGGYDRDRAPHLRGEPVLRSLDDWLRYIEAQHPAAIALGLERVSEVLGRLYAALACPVITVGGTNGKGSTCAMLESTLRAAGCRTGLYTSPHLVRYNERVRIAGLEVQDSPLCEAFAQVEKVRGQTPLTYFEFGTLAALWLFARENLDAVVLEVGLGGRLDAVNAFDADCAVLTSVGIDHVEYLGADRESIGREKAGIFRPGRPAVSAAADPPRSVTQAAGEKLFLGQDFGYVAQANQWTYWGPGGRRAGLAYPALRDPRDVRPDPNRSIGWPARHSRNPVRETAFPPLPA